MLKEIKKEIIELSLGSTVYGVPNLFRSKNFFSRILWITFLLTSSAATCYWIYYGIIDYLSHEVVTVIETIYEQPSEFPTVSLCPNQSGDFKNITLRELVKECTFANDQIIEAELYNHFEEFITLQYEKCFRFNSGKNMSNHSIPIKNSTIGGRNDRLMLDINSNSDLFLWIHNKTTSPTPESYNNHDDPLRIAYGTINNIAIERTIETKLEKPYRDCYKDPKAFDQNKTIINYILNKSERYSQIRCLELCFDLYYIQNNTCDCKDTKLGSVWFDCWIRKENSNLTSCTYKFKNSFYQNKLVEFCSNYCPLECDTISFSYTLSSSKFNSTVIQIYYRTLKHTTITQQAMISTFDFVSSLGGSLGLFIGLSFVSLFEIIEILMAIVFNLINKHNRPNQNDNSNDIKTRQNENDQRSITSLFEQQLDTRIKEIEQRLNKITNSFEPPKEIQQQLNATIENRREVSNLD